MVPSGYAASRWRLDRRNDPTDLQSPTAAAVDVERVAWPCADAHLRHKLDEVVQRVHEMTGILPPDLLHRAMLRVMELASESIEVTDTSVRLLHVNPAFEAITGWPLHDVVGLSTGELFRAGTHDPLYYVEILKTLRAGDVWRGPLVGRRRDGELSFQEATLAPVRDAAGVTVAFVAIKRDVRRDELAVRALESREQRFHTMVDGAADGIFVQDSRGTLADVNASGCQMLQRDRAELLQDHSLYEYFRADDGGQLLEILPKLAAGAPVDVSGVFIRQAMPELPVSLRLGVFLFGGEQFVLVVARDVSARVELETALRKRTEELQGALDRLNATLQTLVQREKLAALGTLVAGVAHEVNTPLGVALTALGLAEQVLLDVRTLLAVPAPSRRAVEARLDDLARTFSLAFENARRAATLVADFKKVSVDQTSEIEREIDLGPYLRSVLSSLSPILRRINVVTERIGEDAVVLTRPGALAQIVSNLMQNCAIHAFADEQSTADVWLRYGRVGEQVLLEVEDHGNGIPPELLARIYDPFVSSRMGTGGSGLGMHVVHSLVVVLLQGSIDIQSVLGQMTRVQIALPYKRSGSPQALAAAPPSA